MGGAYVGLLAARKRTLGVPRLRVVDGIAVVAAPRPLRSEASAAARP